MLLTNWLGNLTSRILKRPVYRSRERRALRRRWQAIVENRISTTEVLEDRTLLTTYFVDDDFDALDDYSGYDTEPGIGGEQTAVFGATAFATIEEALFEVAATGDTIIVAAGNYTPGSTLIVDKSVTIQGAQAGVDPRPGSSSTRVETDDTTETIIDGGGSLSRIFQISADNVTLDGLVITNGTGDLVYSGSPVDQVIIQNNIISNSSGDEGVQLKQATNSTIQYNYIHDTAGDGANYDGSSNSSIRFNEFDHIFSTNGAIYVDDSEAITIEGNLLELGHLNLNDGIKVNDYSGIYNTTTSYIINNVIHDSYQDGITVGRSNVVVSGNEISGSTSNNGVVYVSETVDNIQITNNSIHDNLAADSGTDTNFAIRIGRTSTNPRVPTNVVVRDNSIVNNDGLIFFQQDTQPNLDAARNWWGTSDAALIAAGIVGVVDGLGATNGGIDFSSLLSSGADTSAAPGFQSSANTLVVHDLGGEPASGSRIQNALELVNASGTLLLLPGSYNGNVDATSTGINKNVTLFPGNPVGQVIINGDLKLNSDDTIVMQIAGPDAIADYDQITVNGDFSVVSTPLSLPDLYDPQPGDQFVLFQNAGATPMSGTFTLDGTATFLTDGYEFTDFLGVTGQSAFLTYSGGDGNDVAIVVEDDTPQFTLPVNGSPDQYTLRVVGENVQISDDGTGDVLYNVPLAALGGPLVIEGEPGQDDTLTVDLTGVDETTSLQIVFNGGTGGNDALNLTGGSLTTMGYYFDNASDGHLRLNGSLTDFLSYTGLEPITSSVNTTNVTLNYSGASETITITDAGSGQTTIDSTAGESLTFLDPSGILLLDAGAGDDVINLDSLAADYSAELRIVGGTDNDILNVNTALSLASDQSLLLTAETINLNNGNVTTGGTGVTQSYHGDVVLGADANIVNTTGDTVYFDFTVSGNHTFHVSAGGHVIFYDDVTTGALTATAGGLVGQVAGSVNTGAADIDLTAGTDIALTNLTTTGEVRLTALTGGVMDNSTAETSNITAHQLAIRAAERVGEALDHLDTQVDQIAIISQNDSLYVTNGGDLIIGEVDGLVGATATSGILNMKANGALTIDSPVDANYTQLFSIDTAASGEDINVNADVTSHIGVVSFYVGDDIHVASGVTVDSANSLNFYLDNDNADSGVGSVATLIGTFRADPAAGINVYGDTDNDSVQFDSNGGVVGDGGTLDGVETKVIINLGSGDDTVIMDDSGDTTGDTIAITNTGAGQGNVTGAGLVDFRFLNLEDLTLATSTQADDISVSANENTAFNIRGGNPTGTPGDTLRYSSPSGGTTTLTPDGTDGGTISVTGGYQDVVFDEIENLSMGESLVVNGTSNSDMLTITATSSNSGTYQLNGGPIISFSNITDFTFNGMDGLDHFIINNPTGALFDPVNGVHYDGGAGGGTIYINGGQATTIEHRLVSSANGSVFYDGESTATISYVNVGTVFAVTDQVSVADRILTLTTGDEDIVIADAEFGVGTTVNSDGAPSVSFSNPSDSLTINSTVGTDTLTVYDLGLGFDADFNLNGGNVEFIRDLDFLSGNLNLNVDQATISAALTTTGTVDITATGAIQMLSSTFNGSINAGTSDINLTGSSVLLRGLETTGDVSVTATTTGIFDNNSTATNITADQVVLRSVSGGHSIEMQANTLAATNTTGDLFLSNVGDLTIGTVDGLSGLNAAGGVIDLIVSGSLTINENVYASDSVDLATWDTSNAGEDLTINANVTSNSGFVSLTAADILTVASGATVSGGEVHMFIDSGTAGLNDSAGGIANLNGTLLGFNLDLTGGFNDDQAIIDSNGGTTNDGGTVDAIPFPFTFYGLGGFDSFILDDSGDTTGDTVNLSNAGPGSGTISGLGDADFAFASGVDQVTLTTGSDADEITVAPNTVTAFSIFGGDPDMSPGDSLTYLTPYGEVALLAPAGTDGGTISIENVAAGYKDVNFDEIEDLMINENLTIEGTAGDDVLTIIATDANSGTYQLNDGPVIDFFNLTDLTFNGLDGDDRLVINNPTGGLFDPVDGIIYNGGSGGETSGDTLEILGGTAGTVEHRFINDSEGSILFNNESTATISYTGLEPIVDTIAAAARKFQYSDIAETITLSDVGSGQSSIDSTAGELVTFANPTGTLQILTGDGDDTINVDSLAADLGASLEINGQGGASDVININSTLSLGAANTLSLNTETINLNGGTITSGGTQYFSGDVFLGADTTIDSGNDLFLEGTVDGAFTLDLAAGNQLALLGDISTGALTASSAGIINMLPGLEINTGSDDISLTADTLIFLSVLTTTGNVEVTSTSASIIDTNGTDINITADKAVLRAQGDIADSGAELETEVNLLAAVSATGDIRIKNTGDLEIGSYNGLSGLSAVNGTVVIDNAGAITVSENITASQTVSLDTDDVAGTDDDLSITNGATQRG
ncbi:hypothetical protein Pan153_32490 [Gimesia panareensis]|uniref:Right handed beta helix domain-containing protein n=1 Tax=Gimesia panareensis TaxID=2527978 RepID=A0A518FQP1_9PLAN|nr:right-handed parallel beta-helix repeat-containing protein [Gimesia panareensis]QDV18590.1 hypothetical protein Pan153_32490 [Gimesia panareensis]